MGNNFDDLFNEFFGNNKRKRKKINKGIMNNFYDDIKNTLNLNNDVDATQDLINKLNSFVEDLNNEDFANPYGEKLGEPDVIENYEKDGLHFEKKIWNLEHGQMIKINMLSTPFESNIKTNNVLSLEKQLELALNEERYEDATKLRDEIKSNKKSK
jgi:hypothetical protein